MKKFAKMSLVAAVAVAGLTSTVSAKDLSEAIKGVDVSGTAVIRYNDYKSKDMANTAKDATVNYTKLVVNVKAPVNDTLTFNTSIAANNAFGGTETSTTSTDESNVAMTKMNFTSTAIQNTSVIVGKMGIPTPWTVASDSDGYENIGTGVAAIVKAGPTSITAAYFNQVDATTSATASGLATIGVNANIAGVSLEAFYADLRDTLDSYTIAADYKLPLDGVAVSIGVRHTELELDTATTKNKLTQGYIKAKAGMFAGFIKYGETGKDGGTVAFEGSASTAMEGWNTGLSGQTDASYLMLGVSAQVLPTFNVAINHFERSDDTAATTNDAKELYTQLTWKPSKNFYTYVRLGRYEEKDSAKSNVGRLQAEYKF